MGCAGSKLDDLPTVTLCRDRTNHLADAIRLRYALADAHASYLLSLRSIGESLHAFLNGHDALPPASPVLPLPTQRKGDPLPPPTPSPPPPISAVRHSHSRSHSGSHIHFHSSDSDSDSDAGSPLHSGDSSPIHLHPDPAETLGATYFKMNYARSRPVVSESYEQRPRSPETVQFSGGAEPSSSSSSSYPYYGNPYPDQYPNQNPNSYSYPNQYPNQNPNLYSYPYPPPSDYSNYAGMDGFYGYSNPPSAAPPPPEMSGAGSSTSRPPPPPPSPPRTSTWDFLNLFEQSDSYYPAYTPSRNSKDVREEEGIPDLEEDHEVVKEAYDDRKFVASTSAAAAGKAGLEAKENGFDDGEKPHYKERSVDASSSQEAHMVDKNVVTDEIQGQGVAFAAHRYQDISEVAMEIKAQFVRVSDSGVEVSKILEVGKLPYYHRKSGIYQVSSRMIGALAPPSTSKNGGFLNFEEDNGMGSRSLSSTLQKLYIWEEKLYDEVRAEEKMRVLHDSKCERLKRLDDRGAEQHKVDATQTAIRKLSTKIRIAIQVVDSISNKINKLRDEELWPQLNELIQGLLRMWKLMLECHRTQCHAISEARSLDSTVNRKLSDAHMAAAMQFQMDLLKWIASFSAWVIAQKSFAKALNDWLLKCLLYEPEETPDGIAKFSPGRIGAPPVFVICNQWAESIEMISEREVVDAMKVFAMNVLHLWEDNNAEQRQRLMANRDMDRRLKTLERDAQTVQKAVDALNKQLVLVSGQSGIPLSGHVGEASSLQSGLRQIFEAMESFAASSVKAYEDVHTRSERVVRENAKVP